MIRCTGRRKRARVWFDEGKLTLTQRVKQIYTGAHWCEEPYSRICHMVSNVQLLDVGPTEVKVKSRFLLYKNRLEDEENLFFGKRLDTLRRMATPGRSPGARSSLTRTSCWRKT